MAQQGAQLDQETLSCSICLDLLKDPVTIPCGHSYCRSCIKRFWHGADQRKSCSCPQCRKTFKPRPELVKNTMLAALVEQMKLTGLHVPAADGLLYAGPGDVSCDVCTGRKLKAVKSCLQCLISYCGNHLQPHYQSAAFKKHKLVEPSEKIQENISCRHDESMRMFCHTDQQGFCYLCSVDQHRGHDTVSATAEKAERSRRDVQQKILDREEDLKVLQQQLEVIGRSADKAVEDSERIFEDLISLLQRRSYEVKQQIRSQQEAEVSQVRDIQEKLEQEIMELKMNPDAGDHDQFLASSRVKIRPPRLFEDVTAAVSELGDSLQDVLRDAWTNISQIEAGAEPEPTTREEFLRYSRDVTLDPNTANAYVLLSDGNRRAERTSQHQFYASHPDRFAHCGQVLGGEGLTGRCYWEVEWRGGGGTVVAVAYKTISRTGTWNQVSFGHNENSWALSCFANHCEFRFNNIKTPIEGPGSSRVGVYLDHRAGLLAFYCISETMTLLHKVKTKFTQPLHAGLWLYSGATAEFCKLI